MKEMMIALGLMFTLGARSAVLLKHTDNKLECTINTLQRVHNQFDVVIKRNLGPLEIERKNTVTIKGLDKTIALAFRKTSSHDVVNVYGMTYSAFSTMVTNNGAEMVEFNLDTNDSNEARYLVYTLTELCKR